MESDSFKTEILLKYNSGGEDKFYKFLLFQGVTKLASIEDGNYKGISPEIEFLAFHDKFITLYRREGDENYIAIAKVFRRVAHKMYRIMRKRGMASFNSKFLNAV